MNRFLMAFRAYTTIGIGVYHSFWGVFNFYGLTILMIGLLGVVYDIS